MSVYFIANIKIHDQEEYRKYLDECDDIFRKHQGEYLGVDNNPQILEGRWDYTKTVMIRFDTREALLGWYESEDYQRIVKHRLAAAQCDTIVVQGK